MKAFDTLAEWLAYLETLHPQSIAMGLDRVRAVYQRLGVALDVPVIVVAGTNGKGSTCAFLDAMLRAAGYRVGLYTSPHLARYNERVRIDGQPATDATLMSAFAAVERARVDATPPTPLTYFEFGTLAALMLFAQQPLDALVLEVGLGGRLDAVNLVDADVAVITTVDLDHQDFLGDTREAIGAEKAGILRAGRPAVVGERDPPASVLAAGERLGAALLRLGEGFDYVDQGTQWRYRGPGGERYGLPMPALRGRYQLANASTAMAALGLLAQRLPVDAGAVRTGLTSVALRGRFQVIPGRPTIVLDVAHNPQAARMLAATLGDMGFHPRTLAVFGMLADKDIATVVDAVRARIDRWFVAPLPGPRGATAGVLAAHLRARGVADESIVECTSVADALAKARSEAVDADRIVAFGSFLTVAAALAALQR
ncbi:MAG TPA: bifunctional tetrahydrofolate synthase/dihydrofolate synthase [Casimicrobiaceae bacterium]|nr:bifunctional tetrahydrofolate synthase/dihydrofolate synthase [Casimicrobiaceae bacterium]